MSLPQSCANGLNFCLGSLGYASGRLLLGEKRTNPVGRYDVSYWPKADIAGHSKSGELRTQSSLSNDSKLLVCHPAMGIHPALTIGVDQQQWPFDARRF
jgi:hypothetical protein